MPFDTAVLSDTSLQTSEGGYVLSIRLPWMRSVPWSCVEGATVTLDGAEVDPAALAFEVDGEQLSLDVLADHFEDFWVVGREVRLHVPVLEPKPAGDVVRVELGLRLRIPYLILGPAGPLVLPVTAVRELTVDAGRAAVPA